MTQLDRHGIRLHVPNTTVRHRGVEFDQQVRVNSLGLRGDDLDERKPRATTRVLVLGDSFVEGAQVALEETFVARIERTLASRFAGRRWEVINAGVSRYGTADEIELFELYGRRLSPDIVMLGFFTGNDVADNRESRFFRVRDGALVETPPLPPSPTRLRVERLRVLATSHSHVVQLLRDRVNELALRWTSPPARSPGEPAPREPISDADWALTAALVEELERRVSAAGARLWLLIIPSRERVLDTEPPQAEVVLHERLVQLAKARSLPCIDLLPPLREAARRGSPYYRIDAHWNARGHETAASAIMAALTATSTEPLSW